MPRTPAGRNGLLLLLPLLLILAACQSNNEQARLARLAPDSLYERANRALYASNYEEAIRIYEALSARYPFTPQARQSRLDLIYAYYKSDEKESAKDAADTFIRENPTHPRIDYAWYIKGLIDFERVPHRLERWFNVDLSERPPSTATDALQSFRIVVERFPKSAYAPDARQRMIFLRNRLAAHDVQIARYYASRSAWIAASLRARQVIEDYDGAPAVKDALRMLIHCYRELNLTELAEKSELVFQANYPDESVELPGDDRPWWMIFG